MSFLIEKLFSAFAWLWDSLISLMLWLWDSIVSYITSGPLLDVQTAFSLFSSSDFTTDTAAIAVYWSNALWLFPSLGVGYALLKTYLSLKGTLGTIKWTLKFIALLPFL